MEKKELFKTIYNPFSRYADGVERKADWMLKWLVFYDKFSLQRKLTRLMQKNLVTLNLWLERKYKGYRYLTRSNRKKLYANTQKIVKNFETFCGKYRTNELALANQLSKLGFDLAYDRKDKIQYLSMIMAFLAPGRYYEYLEGASFGKLLKDPEKEKMIGDCNQIVTFYTFLYSLRYPVTDLKIKLLPEHVCLHYDGIDIEATNGTFQHYREYEHILPIVELLTTNLLDVSDFRDSTLKIETRVMVNAAELAYKISSMRDIVERNLQVSYHNLAIDAMKVHDFDTAIFFVQKVRDPELASSIYHNAIIHYVKISDFGKARYYLAYARDPELKDYVFNREGYYYYNQGNYQRALQIYENIGNREMIKACYAGQYNDLQKKVAGAKTVESAKYYKADYQKMKQLARQMGDNDLEKNVDGILKQL